MTFILAFFYVVYNAFGGSSVFHRPWAKCSQSCSRRL